MPLYRIGGKLVLFIHIPKTAGTSIETMLGLHPECESIHCIETGSANAFNAAAWCSPQHFHAKLLDAMFDITKLDIVFSVIRDPLRRLISEHTMRVERGDSECVGFDSWYQTARALRKDDPYAYDNHLRPAHEFITEYSYIFDLADGLNTIWLSICELIGVSPGESQMQRIKPCGGRNQSADSISAETVKLVASDYAVDYSIKRRMMISRSSNRAWVRGSDLL